MMSTITTNIGTKIAVKCLFYSGTGVGVGVGGTTA